MQENFQTGILAALPAHASYLCFTLQPNTNPRAALRALLPLVDGCQIVMGLGASLVTALGGHIDGLHDFAGIKHSQVALPATPADLWLWLRAPDRGALVQLTVRIQAALSAAFCLHSSVDAFVHEQGRDLTGYEDGTENPKDTAAMDAALVQQQGAGLDGASFVAVQQWRHQFTQFNALSRHQQDQAIGRRRSDNVELEDAPDSSHVKRTAQEDFAPEAFVMRRSMPWSTHGEAGLQFVAFGKSLAAFEAQLTRMSGAEDGIVDALFSFSQPLTGAYFWCPPMQDGQIDLRVFGFDEG